MTHKPVIICITGGMGSGKTTIARIIEKKFDIPVYHADDKAKNLMHKKAIARKIIEAFGEESFRNGKLNTKYLAGQVFGQEKKLRKLEKIVHPEVRKDFKKWLNNQKSSFVLLENAILFKSGMDVFCDFIIYVTAPEEIRIRRIMERDGLHKKEIENRLRHQPENEEFRKKSHFILRNDRSLEEIKDNIEKLIQKIKKNSM